MFIVFQPMYINYDNLLIYDTDKLIGTEIAGSQEFQSTVEKLGVKKFVNVIDNFGTYRVTQEYTYRIKRCTSSFPITHLKWYWEFDTHTLLFFGKPVRLYLKPKRITRQNHKRVRLDLYIYINSKEYLLIDSFWNCKWNEYMDYKDYINYESDEYDYPMVTYIENVKGDESVLLLHYWLGNIFEEDIHILVDKESGEPLGIFYYWHLSVQANICDNRALEFAAKRTMIFGRGWWDWLMRKKN